MYYDVPLFSFNVQVWRYMSFIEFDNISKTGIVILFQVGLVVSELLNICCNVTEVSALTMDLFMFAINLNSVVRIFIVMKNQRNFIQFFESIEQWYAEIEIGSDSRAWKILKRLPKHNRVITLFGFTFGSFGGLLTALFPLLESGRRHPYSMYIPMIDVLKTPYYEIFYALQSFVTVPFIVVTYIPFTNLFISWLMFGIGLLQILRQKLENLPHSNDQEMLRQLKQLIKFHHRIIGYAKDLENLVSFVCFVELVLFTIMLVVLLASLLLVDDIIFRISTVIYAICILYVLFISYWHANEFSSESLQVADAAYNIKWTQSCLEVRKCILILILRCQTPIKIRAGGVVPMTLETFQSLLNASYSYFTMLRGMMAK